MPDRPATDKWTWPGKGFRKVILFIMFVGREVLYAPEMK